MDFNNFHKTKNNTENSSSRNSTDNNRVEQKQSNPIIPTGLISKINNINNRTTANRMYAGYNTRIWKTAESIDYQELIKYVNEILIQIVLIQ